MLNYGRLAPPTMFYQIDTIMSKWIFQDITDFQDEMYRESKANPDKAFWVFNEAYKKKLRDNVDPEIYTRYQIWRCDIYVDVAQIIYDVCEVYPDVTKEQVLNWIVKYKADHHELDVPHSWWHKVGNCKYELRLPA